LIAFHFAFGQRSGCRRPAPHSAHNLENLKMKIRNLSALLALSLFTMTAFSLFPNKSYAAAVWGDCQPTRILLREYEVATICTGGSTWFLVTLNQHSTAFANRYVAVLTSAIAANKPIKILYDNAVGSAGAREVIAVDMLK
jgi:hypothetical protein